MHTSKAHAYYNKFPERKMKLFFVSMYVGEHIGPLHEQYYPRNPQNQPLPQRYF